MTTFQLPNDYRKVASSRLTRIVAHPRIFRMFMMVSFDAYVYVLSPLAKIEYIVDRSTA